MVFVQVSSILKRMSGITPLCRMKRGSACFTGAVALSSRKAALLVLPPAWQEPVLTEEHIMKDSEMNLSLCFK